MCIWKIGSFKVLTLDFGLVLTLLSLLKTVGNSSFRTAFSHKGRSPNFSPRCPFSAWPPTWFSKLGSKSLTWLKKETVRDYISRGSPEKQNQWNYIYASILERELLQGVGSREDGAWEVSRCAIRMPGPQEGWRCRLKAWQPGGLQVGDQGPRSAVG